MLQNLIVKNYRNLSDLKINSLSRVNLITGENNTGKTALLEAISIYSGYNIPEKSDDFGALHLYSWILNLTENRGSIFVDRSKDKQDIEAVLSAFQSVFFDFSSPFEIGSSDDFDSDNKFTARLTSSTQFETPSFQIILRKSKRNKQVNIGGDWIYFRTDEFDSKFIRSNDILRTINVELWDRISLSPLEDDVINALKIIEPKIEKIAFKGSKIVKENRQPEVKLEGDKANLLLQSMGDGINRILTIILALVNAKGSYLIIDEFENGLHYSIQEKLWEVVFKTAKELNVQVFATTHSADCVKAFAKIQNQNPGEGQYIRLQNRKGKIVSVAYSEEDILTATEHNIEPR